MPQKSFPSKCCQIFKHYMQQSPVDFLNAYRLKISCQLLCTTRKSITEIAMLCGFNHLSYFSKYFMECYGCTPREYRVLHDSHHICYCDKTTISDISA
ncbi:helix-turn-helix transcriptional regulator [Blautia wexlerae]|uniref:helix-turn-helix domain-containing protein n=1 Tax=Blautia wexlerae TaxID=418240 RepID=UPI00299F6C4C|nr:helix-turn-helix transcriptional regulator [Blautia wexlerae]